MTSIGAGDAYALSTPDDHRRLYARWAATYDEDFVERERYVYPRTVAAHVAVALGAPAPGAAAAPRTPTVVDVGCGTGALAETLAHVRADAAIDGLDISPEMLAVARAKRRGDGAPLYRDLAVVDLTADRLDDRAGRYDVVTSVGTFTHGHLGPDVLARVATLARPGGRLVIGINEAHFAARGFAGAVESLVAARVLEDATTTRVRIYLGDSAPDAPATAPAPSTHAADTALVLVAVRSQP